MVRALRGPRGPGCGGATRTPAGRGEQAAGHDRVAGRRDEHGRGDGPDGQGYPGGAVVRAHPSCGRRSGASSRTTTSPPSRWGKRTGDDFEPDDDPFEPDDDFDELEDSTTPPAGFRPTAGLQPALAVPSTCAYYLVGYTRFAPTDGATGVRGPVAPARPADPTASVSSISGSRRCQIICLGRDRSRSRRWSRVGRRRHEACGSGAETQHGARQTLVRR